MIVTVECEGGLCLEEAIRELVRLKDLLQVSVRCDFNGTMLIAHVGDTEESVHRAFLRQANSKG